MPKIPILAAIVVSLHAAVAHAWQEPDRSIWSFNGYGTVGIVHSDEDRADYLPHALSAGGPGRSGSVTADLDSRVAMQLSVHPTPRLSAVVQTVVEHTDEGDYEPVLEWANVRYELSSAWSVRAGRIEVDSFLVSDHRKVGFAIPWIRPPTEVYGRIPVTRSDGVDVAYEVHLGEFTYRAQLSIGENGEFDGLDAKGRAIANVLEWNDLALRATYIDVDLDLEVLSPLFDAIGGFGPEGAAVARRYDPAREPMVILALGARYAPGQSFVMGEWTRSRTDSVFGVGSAWYVSGGRRFGDITPYLTFALADRESDPSVRGLTVDAYPPPLAPVAAALNLALNEIRGGTPAQETWTLGVRWDVAHNVDLKVQYDRVDVDDGSPGTFGNIEPGYRPAGADLFSLAVDFVF